MENLKALVLCAIALFGSFFCVVYILVPLLGMLGSTLEFMSRYP